MASKEDQIVSAQVILRPASPRRSRAPVTAENIREFLPSADAAARARGAFDAAGFKLGALVGNSFSISGPMRLFEQVLGARLQQDRRSRAVKATAGNGQTSFELPVARLSPDVASVIEAVTFTPPPDFGPTNY